MGKDYLARLTVAKTRSARLADLSLYFPLGETQIWASLFLFTDVRNHGIVQVLAPRVCNTWGLNGVAKDSRSFLFHVILKMHYTVTVILLASFAITSQRDCVT